MPYPALNVYGEKIGPYRYWYDDGAPPLTDEQSYMARNAVHPASTSNPKRPDGTRAMSAWRHYGGWWRSPSTTKGIIHDAFGYDLFFEGCSAPANIVPSLLQVWDGAADYARLKALSSWTDRQVEYSEALRTAGQTARMVGDLGKGMATELEQAMLKHGKGIARHWKKLPGWYLQYLYGWKPLMDDISNITDRLVKGFDEGNTLHVCLVGKWKGRREVTFSNGGGEWGGFLSADTILLLEQKNKSVFKYAFPADRLPTLEPMGFFGGLWEAAPFSFVVDWVAPVGNWLKALDANTLAVYFEEGCASEMVRTIGVRSEFNPASSPWWITSELYDFDTTLIVKPFNFTRKLESPWSITSRIPFRADLDLNHAAQGLSLLTQAMNRLY